DTLLSIHNAIIRPHLNYCSEVWDTLGKGNSKRLQKLQNRAARVITRTSNEDPASGALAELGWDTLEVQWTKTKAKQMYKVINGLAPSCLTDLFKSERKLFKGGRALDASDKEAALLGFSAHLRKHPLHKPTLLVAHNCHSFDAPRIVHNTPQQQQADEFSGLDLYSGDPLVAGRKYFKRKDGIKLSDLYRETFGCEFNAHDALEDCRTLREVLNEVGPDLQRKVRETAISWSYFTSVRN
ncbi:predicted protein, partial [Nematostella vectensis]